ncbi:uncharacterized protein [Montipora capricornis]|uniref:uncharacterized protein isoform X5 n=1 Tax=Montipora capricornis TaxID=246305 RepID=UPI0035F1A9C2
MNHLSSQGINTAAYWRNKQQDRANYGCKLWLDLLIGGSVMRVLGLNSGDPRWKFIVHGCIDGYSRKLMYLSCHGIIELRQSWKHPYKL